MNENHSINTIDELKILLTKILESRGRVKRAFVNEFEDKLNSSWEKNGDFPDENINTVFSELLVDMAYYQPNPIIRLTDKKRLFDDKQLNKRIKEALDKLEKYHKE